MALSPTSSRTSSSGSAGALTLLSTTTLGADGPFDVSGISGAYNDLVLVMIARSTRVLTSDTPTMRVNNDSSAIYWRQRLRSIAAVVDGSELIATTSFDPGALPGSSSPAGSFGVLELTIYGYASTTWHKVIEWESYMRGDTPASGQTVNDGGGVWGSTAAITRVQVGNGSAVTGNLLTGSQLRIYGQL